MVVCTRWPCRASRAPQRHCASVNTPRALFVVAVVISFETSCKRSYSPGELGDCGVGFVSVLCFVFYHLPVPLLLLILSPTPCFVVSAEHSMVQ